ncbi:MAG: CARDB domain-containing protein, partial [Planctomycetota bacterium]
MRKNVATMSGCTLVAVLCAAMVFAQAMASYLAASQDTEATRETATASAPSNAVPLRADATIGSTSHLAGQISPQGGFAQHDSNTARAAIVLQNATAQFSQAEYPVDQTIDGNVGDLNGWGNSLNPTRENVAVWETVSDVDTIGLRLEFTLVFNLGSHPDHALGKFRLSATTDSRDEFADGLGTGGDVTANWTELSPILATSSSGIPLSIRPDNSILADETWGDPVTDEYRVVASTDLTGITGFRLEALTDASLPLTGPGLPDVNGNFVLTEIQVATFPDCNGNGVDDSDDIAGGTSEDLDENGIPDECEDTVVATPVWARTYDYNNGDDMVWATAVDSQGALIAAGYAAGTGSNTRDALAIKYNADGSVAWTRSRTSGVSVDDERFYGACVDSQDNVILAGLITQVYGPSNCNVALLIQKYLPDGTLDWERVWCNYAWDSARAVSVDDDGYIYVAGSAFRAWNTLENDWLVLKYDPDGNLQPGFPWYYGISAQNEYGDVAYGIAVDASGNVIVVGVQGFSSGNLNWHVRKYDPTGALLWADTYAGAAGLNDYAWAVAVDSNGDIVVNGYTNKGTDNSAGVDWDWLTIKYAAEGSSGQGVRLWTRTHESAPGASEGGYGVTVDGNDQVLATGWVRDSDDQVHGALHRLGESNGNLIGERVWEPNSLIFGAAQRDQVLALGGRIHNGTNYDYRTVNMVTEIEDCNSNGVPDANDIAGGTSQDCNTDGIPDECEVPPIGSGPDCNGNIIPDGCEIGDPIAHNCCETGHGAGCNDTTIETCVCAVDGYCCSGEWDGDCAAAVTSLGCDTCTVANDCNGNGDPDECDIAGGPSSDCNTNNLPDECDIAAGTSEDCNENDVPDDCDISSGSPDCDLDGVPDECEVSAVAGYRVSQESAPGTGDFDDHPLGIIQAYDTTLSAAEYYRYDLGVTSSFNGPAPTLTDDRSHLFLVDCTDGLSLFVVYDSATEADGGSVDAGYALSGDPDGVTRTVEDDSPEFEDIYTGNPGDTIFTAHNVWSPCCTDGLVLTGLDGPWSMMVEITSAIVGLNSWAAYASGQDPIVLTLQQNRRVRIDAIFDPASSDCNANGVPDACDITEPTSEDCNINEIPDECEVPPIGEGPDCNSDNVPDECQVGGNDCNSDSVPDDCQLTDNDCNTNGVPDECDLSGGTSEDCNVNGTLDECDIAAGSSEDCQLNGVPDECDVEHAILYLAARDTNEVFRYLVGPTVAPILQTSFTDTSINAPFGITLAPSGELFVVNNGDPAGGEGSVTRFLDPQGVPEFNGVITGGFNSPHDAVFLNEELFVVNSRANNVLRFLFDVEGNTVPNGSISTGLGSTHARMATVSPAGDELFVSECCATSELNRYEFDPAGNATWTGAITGGGLTNPHDMAFSPWGELFAVNGQFNAVSRFVFDEEGNASPNGEITGNGLDVCLGVAFSPWGELFVTNGDVMTVSRWTFDSTHTALPNGSFTVPGRVGPPLFAAAAHSSADCNANGIPDECDLASGTSEDCQTNGIPDECELGGPGLLPFFDDFESGASHLWGNERGSWIAEGGVYFAQIPGNAPPTYSSLRFALTDFAIEVDINGTVDGGLWLRADSNYSGVLLVTKGTGLYWHTMQNGQPGPMLNPVNGLFPAGGDIHVRVEVIGETYAAFLNGGTTPVTTLTTSLFPSGRVGLYDYSSQTFDNVYLIPDVNGDGVLDALDMLLGNDCNANGIPDECDLTDETSEDCQPNDIPDECDIAAGTSNDVNTDGIPDECQVIFDCNENDVEDADDIAGGTSADCNENVIPDECEDVTVLIDLDFNSGIDDLGSSQGDLFFDSGCGDFSVTFTDDGSTGNHGEADGVHISDIGYGNVKAGTGDLVLGAYNDFDGPFNHHSSGIVARFNRGVQLVRLDDTDDDTTLKTLFAFDEIGSLIGQTAPGSQITFQVDTSMTNGRFIYAVEFDSAAGTAGGAADGIVFTIDNFHVEGNMVAPQRVLLVNVNGGYNEWAEAIHQTLRQAGAEADYVNLAANGAAAGWIQSHVYDQIWVFDLSSATNDDSNYPSDWQAIADWFNPNPSRVIICDGRMLSSYAYGHLAEGELLTENYYVNMMLRGGGILLGTDHDVFQYGINTVNDLIGLQRFSGNFVLNKIPVDTTNPLMNFPNDMGPELWDNSSPGQTPYGLQPNGRILYTVAWHSNNPDTPGISATIEGEIGFHVEITSPADGAMFDAGEPITFTAEPTGGDPPFTYEWSSNLDGVLGTGEPLEVSTLSVGEHVVAVLAEDGAGRDDYDSITITVLPKADLELTACSAPDTIDAGQTAEVNWTVTNLGDLEAAGSWMDTVYLSDDPVVGNDIELDSFVQSGPLAGGGSYLAAELVSIAGDLVGEYWIIVATDTEDDVTEPWAENNNTRVCGSSTINDTQPPETTIISGPDDGAYINTTGVSYEWTGQDNGTPIGQLTYSYCLAPQAVGCDPGVGPFGADTTVSLTGLTETDSPYVFKVVARDLAGNIDSTPDQRTFTVDVTPIAITGHMPDAVVNDEVCDVEVTFSEEPFGFAIDDVTMTGPGGDIWIIEVVGTVNPLVYRFRFACQRGGGNYNFIVGPDILDVAGNPMDQAYVGSFSIAMPDLTPETLTIPPSGVSGEQIEVNWTVINDGSIPAAGSWKDAIYLSDDADWGDDILLGEFTVTGPLADGATYNLIQNVTIPPFIEGDFWIIVVVDSRDAVAEFNEGDDNRLISTDPIQVDLAPYPDLQITALSGPPSAWPGQRVTMCWAVTNDGSGATGTPFWKDDLYLSSDQNIGGDWLLGRFDNPSSLGDGESYQQCQTVTIPSGALGCYYFLARTDSLNQVFEYRSDLDAESNNDANTDPCTDVMLPPPADLQVTLVNGPGSAWSGENIIVSWDVANLGESPTPSEFWQDSVYLSEDETLDPSDIRLCTFGHSGALIADESYSSTQLCALPRWLSGVLYVFVATDSAN